MQTYSNVPRINYAFDTNTKQKQKDRNRPLVGVRSACTRAGSEEEAEQRSTDPTRSIMLCSTGFLLARIMVVIQQPVMNISS